MSDTIHWVLVTNGEVAFECHTSNSKEILQQAQWAVEQRICDHLRHALPLKVTEQVAREFDIRAFSLPREDQEGVPERLVLPYQKWVDEYYQSSLDDKKETEEREYKRYLELREQHEPRRLHEADVDWSRASRG